MANLKNVIYLSNEDYATLVNTGTVTINGTTLTYDENNLYITPDLADAGMQNPMTTAGDLIVGGTNGLPTRLAKGSNGQALVINNGNVAWQTVGSGDGTVTSVQVQATLPVVSSQNTAQTVSLNTTISLADAYGDTKNPYGSKTQHHVLAAPSTASGTPSFRALDASDIPALNYQTDTSTHAGGTAVTLNNQSKASSSASFYAPTSGGATNTILVGKGTTTAPEWSSSTTWSGAAGALVTDSSGVISVNTTSYTETVVYTIQGPALADTRTLPFAVSILNNKTYANIVADLQANKRVILEGSRMVELAGETTWDKFTFEGYNDSGIFTIDNDEIKFYYFTNYNHTVFLVLDPSGGDVNNRTWQINSPLIAISAYDTTVKNSTNAVQNKAVYTALQGKESTTNKTISISNASTDTEYPSAKAVYDTLENKDSHYEFAVIFDDMDGIYGTLTLVGSDIDKALRSPVPINFLGTYTGEATLFKRDSFSVNPEDNLYYVLFPDTTKISLGGQQFWINGAYFYNSDDPLTSSSTFMFDGWSTPNSAVIADEKINALDISDITANLGADKTITALSETNGLISASASQIAIKSDQVTKATTNVTIATNDVLPVFDNSDNNKLKGGIAFDTTNTSGFLRKDGTWATPVGTAVTFIDWS